MGRSLRGSSQKGARDATQSITLQAEEGAHKKSSRDNGAYKRLAFGSPKCWNQLRQIPRMSQCQILKLPKLMTM